jgi:transcriptional regulator with AAA-type ATPase domain
MTPRCGTGWRISLPSCSARPGPARGQAAAAIGRSGFIPYLPAEHRFAENFTETFIATNLSQFPEDLIESELFGHRKGAFTGAIDHHQGVFERCSAHGALFLDEIGEGLDPGADQAAAGAAGAHLYAGRPAASASAFPAAWVAATNQPLDQLRSEGRFRNDFFYRLCSDVIEMPTLRQRLSESSAEIVELVRLLVARITGVEVADLVGRVLEQL